MYVVLNLYPYNPGHLMVVPYRRVSELEDLDEAESVELMAFTQKAIRVIKAVSRPMGFNVGLNLGQVSGGSLAEHLHMHVVPRWIGDANFITIIGGSKIIPQLLRETRELLAKEWAQTAVSNFYLMTRAAYVKLSTPVAKVAVRVGLTPDMVTIIGTAGAVIAALTMYPIGQLWWGSFTVCVFVLADMLDGAMARVSGGGSRFGAVLDATCDRISDGAIFCGLLWWAAFGLHNPSLMVAMLICLVSSQVISYVKARAEASGLRGDGGLIERPERLVIVLNGAGLSDLFSLPWLLPVAMWVLAVASIVTIGQRVHSVRCSPEAMDKMEKPEASQQ